MMGVYRRRLPKLGVSPEVLIHMLPKTGEVRLELSTLVHGRRMPLNIRRARGH
jgi:hypothetical protein